jgi:hypothetical protein
LEELFRSIAVRGGFFAVKYFTIITLRQAALKDREICQRYCFDGRDTNNYYGYNSGLK